MVRFLHTSDWQLGMTRYFLGRIPRTVHSSAVDAIRTLGRIAKEEGCQFMLVCGDAFESNQVDRKTVARSLEALKSTVPVFILPGITTIERSFCFTVRAHSLNITGMCGSLRTPYRSSWTTG